ncbi:MAG: sugar transferase [Chloroflexi bacterium]|nr:sugar transferase [Chloroflexota bacterium]
MSKRGQYLLFSALIASDTVAVAVGLIAAMFVVSRLGINSAPYLGAIQWALLGYLLVFAVLGLYDLETVLEDSQEYATVATGCTYGIILLVVINALGGRIDLSIVWLGAGWAATVFAVALGRFLMRRVVRAFRRQGHLIVRAIIVGADQQGRTIARQFRSVADSGVHVVGFVDDFLPAGTPVQDGLTVLGHPTALADIAREHNATELVVVPSSLAWETFQEILERSAFADGLKIRISPGYYDLLATTPRVAHRNFVPLIVLDRARLTGFDLLLKLAIDYGAGLIALGLSLPLMALIATWLRVANRGPIIYRQSMLGQGGRPFRATVFRLEADRPGAAFLRDTGLALLPLLFAVPAGRMSLVGPRPIPEEDRRLYQRWLPNIASVKPGVSGPWAVVPVASLAEEMRAAIFYIRNWTIWLDLQILVQTVLVVLRRRWERLTE